MRVDPFGQVSLWTGRDNEGAAWLVRPGEESVYTLDTEALALLSELGSAKAFFTDTDGVMWIGSTSGLLRYDPAGSRAVMQAPRVLIRRVATIRGDSLVYGGMASASYEMPTLSYRDNSIQFEFATPAFEDAAANQYQYLLDGFDDGWSEWTAETKKDYTNLPEGLHRFRVRTKNIYGHVSREATFAFCMLPPWYRTWWAYALYVFLAGSLIYGAVRWRLTRLAEENRRLEGIVTERTAALQQTLHDLTQMQDHLIHAEKMASLGHLTAGIAHEIKNPLNFVNNFSQLSIELAEELMEELETCRERSVADVLEELEELLTDLKENARRIQRHGQRADHIVRGMMQHAQGAAGDREPTDVNAMLNEYINLAYHGMRAQQTGFTCEIERDYDEAVGHIDLVPDEIGRVFLNLLNNAFYAVHEKDQAVGEGYTPRVQVVTHRESDYVVIRVRDNGPGIPDALRQKIFEPFFTTKPTGTGTGLGLSLSYDIVRQGHGGLLTVEGDEATGVTFVITLPTERHGKEKAGSDSERTTEGRPPAPLPRSEPVKRSVGEDTLGFFAAVLLEEAERKA